MHIIELTELQFKNYSNIHSKKNYKQSIEYAAIKKNKGYKPLYLGLIDDSNNVHAATLILEKNINNKHKYGIVPNGYLINFYNIELLKTFTIELKNYLKKLNYVYIRINPYLNYQVYTSDFVLKENNSSIINELKRLGYEPINNTAKYNTILRTTDIKTTYKNFKRSLRRNINNCLKKGIMVYEGEEKDKELFLNLIKNKSYYQQIIDNFTKDTNKFEFYIAKLIPETYVNNYMYLLKKEQINNDILNEKLKNPNIRKTKKLLDKKMTSDRLLTTYNNEIIKATNLYKNYPNGIIISGVGVITNQREVIFLKECYNNDFKDIRSIPMIKWEIIKKSITLGYRNFNLGDIVIAKNQITKTGYNGDIIEYSNDFDLVINDIIYKLNGFINKKNN